MRDRPDKLITCEEFLDRMEELVSSSKAPFAQNMETASVKWNSFCDWADMFMHWLELMDEEMCKEYYNY